MSTSRLWLVSVCVGNAYDYGPSCIVQASNATEAVEAGIAHMRQEDPERGGYGITCDHCENDAVNHLSVVNMADVQQFTRGASWTANSQADPGDAE